jgi:hypothetical protein
MRSAVFGLALSGLLAFAAAAHDLESSDCMVSDVPCALTFALPDFRLMQAAPVVLGPNLRLLGADTQGRVQLLDLSLADGAEVARQDFDLVVEEPQFTPGFIDADGATLAVHLWTGGEELGLQFLDASGRALGLLGPALPEGWGLEMSPAGLVALLAGQNLMRFQEGALRGSFYRFDLAVTVADGAFAVRETSPAMSPTDTLTAFFERRLASQLDPVGYETAVWQGGLSAVTTEASDGSPSRLLVRSDEGGELVFDQHLGEARMGYAYRDARLSPDGARLATIREADQGARLELMVFDVATTRPLFTAAMPQGWQQQLVWLPELRAVRWSGPTRRQSRP